MKKVSKGFLAIFLAVVMSFGSLSAGVNLDFAVKASASSVEYCMFPVKTSKNGVSYVNMSRSNYKFGDDDQNAYNYSVPSNKRNSANSHHYTGYAFDFCGGDTKLYAPFTGTLYISKDNKTTNGIYFVSNNPVMLANGKVAERVTILLIHDDDISNLKNGMVIKQGEYFYDQGTYQSGKKGKVALHTHLEIAIHKETESLVDSYNKFDDSGYGIQADDAFYVTKNAKLVDIEWKVSCGSKKGTTGKMKIKTAHDAISVYTVNFNANGGAVSTKSKSIANGGTYGTLPTPTRSGYKFIGWYTKASGGTKINSSAKVNSSHTLYAHWEKIANKLSITVKNAANITQNSAKVSATCSYSGARPSEVSVYIGTSKNNLKKYSSDKINHSKNPFDIWYNIKNLKPGTTYYYQFHAVVNGTDKAYGEIKSFKTTPKASSSLTMNVKGASKITKTSARVDATCSYSGTRPSEVSVYIGTSPNNMKKYSSDAINHSKNPFNIWYNLSGLKKNTIYYYQFHAKVNGVDKAYGEIKDFKTAR